MEDGSLKKIGKQADKTAASTEKLTKSNDKYKKKQKGVAGATSNSTKAFSKMSTGIEGTLVPAYATLAANVFAITAAFGALKRASAASQLEEGLLFTGRAAGQNLKMVSDGLREITGTAISAADAMSAVAIGTSAGFDQNQLEGLASVAKGASLALGRDMTDAMDRLIRGAAKLEPEILDELGIMVRLDKSTRDYADSVGKTVEELTMFEKRMAFTNAIIDQGSNKFLALSNHMKANPFDRLAATFDNISKGGINMLNTVLGPLAGFFADNMPVMIGAMVLFGTGVAKQMIPALTNQADSAREAADAQNILAKQEVRGLAKTKGRTKAAKALIQAIEKGEQTTEHYVAALKAEEIQLKRNNTLAAKGTISEETLNQRKADGAAETQRYAAALATEEAARKSGTQVEALSLIQGGEMREGLKLGLAGIREESDAKKESRKSTKGLTRAKLALGDAVQTGTKRMRLFGAAALGAIPVIGQVIMAIGIAKAAYDKFFAEPPSFLDKALEDNQERMEEFPAVLNQLTATFDLINSKNDQFIAGLRVTVGQLAQIKQGVADIRLAEEGDGIAALARSRVALEEARRKAAAPKKDITTIVPTMTPMSGPSILRSSVEDQQKHADEVLAKAEKAHAKAQRTFDNTSGTAVQGALQMVEQGIIQQEGILQLAIQNENEQLQAVAKDSIDSLKTAKNAFRASVRADGTSAAGNIKILEDAINSVQEPAAVLVNALDSATESTSVLGIEATKLNKTKGSYAPEIEGLKTVLALTMNHKHGKEALNEKYKEAFKLYKIEASEAAKASAKAAGGQEAQAILFKDRRDQLVTIQDTMIKIAKNEHERARLDQEAVVAAGELSKLGKEDEARALLLERMDEVRKQMTEKFVLNKQLERDTEKEILDILKQKLAIEAQITATYNARAAEASAAGMGAAATASLSGQAAVTIAKRDQDALGKDATQEEKDKAQTTVDNALMEQARGTLKGVTEDLAAMGPEGATMSSAIGGIQNFATSFGSAMETMGDTSASASAKVQAGLGAASSLISGMAAMQKAATADKIRGIDQEIAAEKARDGKSAGSVAKLEALEKKKTAAAKKGFEQEKKMKMAQTIISTAQGAIAAYTSLATIPIVGPALGAAAAAMVVSMGAKQLAMISATSFQGGGSIGGADATPSKISIGSRNNTVDLAKSNSASGELAYMRGADGIGGAENFRPAFSGYKHRAGGGYVVGEQGPELFMPDTPGEIIPSGQNAGGMTNVTFKINTVDATGVEELLIGQKGNIIGMIRDAANSYGESFMDGVDTTVYNKTTEGVSRY
jgi:hypothetical protein